MTIASEGHAACGFLLRAGQELWGKRFFIHARGQKKLKNFSRRVLKAISTHNLIHAPRRFYAPPPRRRQPAPQRPAPGARTPILYT
jgi:hypothetical protein